MKKAARFSFLLSSILLIAVGFARSQAPLSAPLGAFVERYDPAIDAIVPADAQVEMVAQDFGIAEGPVWIDDGRFGYVLFSDIPANVIYRWSPFGGVSVFLERSGYTGQDPMNHGGQVTSGPRGRVAVIMLGSNGLTLDRQGRVVVAANADRTIYRLERDGTRTMLADKFDGKRFNGPNDLVVKSNGALYFTDTVYGLRGGAKSPARELPFFAVFLVRDGKVQVVDRDPQGGSPNGIALSPDETYLYVGSGGKVIRYEIQADDMAVNGRLLIESGTDGMKVDQKGNLYLTSNGNVLIVSPDGKRLGQIRLPVERGGNSALNVAFGDPDLRTLYITAQTRLFRTRLLVPGTRPAVRY